MPLSLQPTDFGMLYFHFHLSSDLFKEITTLEKIRNDKMPINELSSHLLSVGIPLSNKTLQEILSETSIDGTGEVSLKQILETLSTSKPASEFEAVHTALNTVSLMNCDRIQASDLKDVFDDLSISIKPEEHEMLQKTLDVDEKGDVSLKTALLALKSNKRFQDFREVNKLAKALDKVTNEKVDVDDVQPVLNGLGIYFPEEELQEVLSSVSIDNKGKLDLKDCLTRLQQMPYFTKVSKIEGPLKALASIRKNVANPDDLDSMMKNIGVPLPQDVIQSALKNVAITEDGTVNLEEFMGNLINSRFSSPPEKMINVSDLDNILGNLGIELTKEELRELRRNLPVNAKGKTDLKTLMDTVQVITVIDILHSIFNIQFLMYSDTSPP
ncbi:EF-hand calcium-binding domain-containing protein 13-like [Sus scrofa]|uniref:EF-hand calcium-binding domain-containing protein 13-like n=1 Tax=Sus scrofa TaxID=9823 RepID=UPI000A2B151C|nr:EF-hand calcium-binding domain-containing protein 13-like [Sus scrofa]